MVRELGSRFAEVERRVRALVEENARLRERVRALERERGSLEETAREAAVLRARKAQVQDRMKRLLHMLESVELRAADAQDAQRTS